MMSSFVVKLFFTVALLAQCHSHPTKEQDLEALLTRLQGSNRQFDYGNAVRNLDSLGGGHLLRQVRNPQIDPLRGISLGVEKRFDSLSGVTFGGQKRGYNVDREREPAEHRFEHQRLAGYMYPALTVSNLNSPDGFGKYREVNKKNFDEIDRSGFDSFVKRNFDEIDRSGFSSFVKKDHSYFPKNGEDEAQ